MRYPRLTGQRWACFLLMAFFLAKLTLVPVINFIDDFLFSASNERMLELKQLVDGLPVAGKDNVSAGESR